MCTVVTERFSGNVIDYVIVTLYDLEFSLHHSVTSCTGRPTSHIYYLFISRARWPNGSSTPRLGFHSRNFLLQRPLHVHCIRPQSVLNYLFHALFSLTLSSINRRYELYSLFILIRPSLSRILNVFFNASVNNFGITFFFLKNPLASLLRHIQHTCNG